MKQQMQEIVRQTYTDKYIVPYNVDEEQELISFCRDDLESLIKTIVSYCASLVSDEEDKKTLLKIGE